MPRRLDGDGFTPEDHLDQMTEPKLGRLADSNYICEQMVVCHCRMSERCDLCKMCLVHEFHQEECSEILLGEMDANEGSI